MSSPDTRRAARAPSRLSWRGFMLIEWMVGITLGLLVVLGALSITTANLAASAAARDAADLQQRADGALRMIGEQVRQAGSVRLEALAARPGTVRFSDQFAGWRRAGLAVSGTEGGPGKPDTLRLSYEPDTSANATTGATTDCLGNTPRTPAPEEKVLPQVDSEYSIAPDSRDSSRNALYCQGIDPRQSVVAGVDDLQLTYAIADPQAEGGLRYVAGNALDPSSRVLAVKVCLQASSDTRSGIGPAVDCSGSPVNAKKLAGRMVRLARGVFQVRHATR